MAAAGESEDDQRALQRLLAADDEGEDEQPGEVPGPGGGAGGDSGADDRQAEAAGECGEILRSGAATDNGA